MEYRFRSWMGARGFYTNKFPVILSSKMTKGSKEEEEEGGGKIGRTKNVFVISRIVLVPHYPTETLNYTPASMKYVHSPHPQLFVPVP